MLSMVTISFLDTPRIYMTILNTQCDILKTIIDETLWKTAQTIDPTVFTI